MNDPWQDAAYAIPSEEGSDMIEGIAQADALPALERMMQFSARRHELITENVANLETPGYRPQDVSVEGFQNALGEAIDRRREVGNGAAIRALEVADTDEVAFTENGLELRPTAAHDNILFHDDNDRNLERIMQDLAENLMAFRAAGELLRSRYGLLHTAISGRV